MSALDDFRVQFPEFDSAGDTMVQAFLDAAALEIDLDVWGPKADQGRFYLAAHKLALSPFGQAARLAKDKDSTTYWTHYTRLVSQVACGLHKVV